MLAVLVQRLDVGAVAVPPFDLGELLVAAEVEVGQDEAVAKDVVEPALERQRELVFGDGPALTGPFGRDPVGRDPGAPGDAHHTRGPGAGQVVDDGQFGVVHPDRWDPLVVRRNGGGGDDRGGAFGADRELHTALHAGVRQRAGKVAGVPAGPDLLHTVGQRGDRPVEQLDAVAARVSRAGHQLGGQRHAGLGPEPDVRT